MAERGWRAAVAMAGLALAACESAPTRIVVVTDGDLRGPEAIDAVGFEIDARAIGGDLDLRVVELGAGRAELPLVLPIVHEGGELGPIVVIARGLRAGEVVVQRSAQLSFVPARSVALALWLDARCARRMGQCPDSETCVAGECVPHAIDSGALPSWRGRDELPDGRAADAGVALPDGGG